MLALPQSLGSPFRPSQVSSVPESSVVNAFSGSLTVVADFGMEAQRQRLLHGLRSGEVFGLGAGMLSVWAKGVQSRPPSRAALRRERELAWRASHQGELRRYAGQWVVLEGEEIIAHGPDPAQSVFEARARGIESPYVFFVDLPGDDVVTFGL